MKFWLNRPIFICLLAITCSVTPTSLLAAPRQQADRATLQLENRSSEPLSICEIFAVRLPTEIVLDLQEKIDLAPGQYKQFAVPPGRYRLLVSDCDQTILTQQQELLVTDRVTLPLAAQATGPTPNSQLQQPSSANVVLQVHNQAEQTICYVAIANTVATAADGDQLFEVNLATGETHTIELVPGNYNLGLADCAGNFLLLNQDVSVQQDHRLSLIQADVNRTACDAHNQDGLTAYRQSHYREALTAYAAALACFRRVGDRAGEGATLNNIAAVYRAQGSYGEALELYEQALAIRQEVGDRVGEGVTLNNIGLVYDHQGHYAESLDFYEQALAIRQEVGDRAGEGRTLNNLGLVYDHQGRYSEALAIFEQALTIRREIGDRAGEGVTLHNIAGVYHNQGQYSEALVNYRQALAIRQAVGDRIGEGATLSGIGTVYQAQGRYEEALATFEQALVIRREVGDRAGEGTTLHNIGLVHRSQGRYSEALVNYERALAIRQAVGDRAGEGRTRNNLGAVYHAQGRYEEALASFEQALAIAQMIGDQIGEGTTLTNIGGVYHNQGRYDEALTSYKQALAIAQKVGNRAGEGATLNNIGGAYNDQGQYSEALAYYAQALVISQKIGDRAGEGATLNNIGLVYHNQGRYSKALASYNQALAMLREVGDRAGEGATFNNIGAVYDYQGRYDQALTAFAQALAIQREVGDRAGEGATLNNIGLAYDHQGRYGEALASYKQTLAIQREVGDRAGEGVTLNNIGLVYNHQGWHGEALTYYAQALTIAQKVGNRAGEGSILHNIGVVHYNQGRYGEALADYEQALAIRREVGDRAGEGATLSNIGVVYDHQGQYGEALADYEQALAIRREVGDRAGEGSTRNNIAGVYSAQRRYDEALASYEQALAIAHEVGDRISEGRTLNNIGVVFANQGRYEEALASYEQAQAIAHEVGDRTGEGGTLQNIGAVYDFLDRYIEALRYYSDGIELLESIRSAAGSDEARISFANNYFTVYDRVIALSHQQGAVAQAFWYSERGRARVLLDAIATGRVQLSDNEVAVLLAAEQEAYAVHQSAQDALAKARAANPPDPVWVDEAAAALAAAETAYTLTVAAITDYSAELANLIPGRQQVLQLADVQALLPADTTLLSYWMVDDKTLAFVITTHDVNLIELPAATANHVLTALRDLYAWRNLEQPHPKPLRQLYQWLVEPLAAHLTTPQLALVPHSLLHYVPFAALTNGEYYVSEQHTLSLLPSASLLPFLTEHAQRAQATPAPHAVVFGNPTTTDLDLPSLAYAASEAQAIASLLGATVYTATAASETQLRTSAADARVIHLAAHGGYNPFNPLYSLIALAADEEQDGHLETHEIFGLSLQRNDLVVLSACQTNVGDLSRGDDIVSLTRAFFFAGTPTVISSLWSVDDAATETLMVDFYKHWLQEGMSKAAALQAAQTDVRADPRWASPFYWAGFVLNGHPGYSKANP